jgi:hypothetical protein
MKEAGPEVEMHKQYPASTDLEHPAAYVVFREKPSENLTLPAGSRAGPMVKPVFGRLVEHFHPLIHHRQSVNEFRPQFK